MIHPDTQIRHISNEIGYGIFATRFIPKGTIVYVKDTMEIEVSPQKYASLPPELQEVVEKYSYIDENGVRIVSWDLAKYVNHCCNCNTMSSGYGFEIAIRDIQEEEEITDEYGMFNFEKELPLGCSKPGCRGKVSGKDLDDYYPEWDRKVIDALAAYDQVAQPLRPFLDKKLQQEVTEYLRTGKNYRSVLCLRRKKQKQGV